MFTHLMEEQTKQQFTAQPLALKDQSTQRRCLQNNSQKTLQSFPHTLFHWSRQFPVRSVKPNLSTVSHMEMVCRQWSEETGKPKIRHPSREREMSSSMYRIDLLYLLSVCTLIMKYTTPAQNASTISTLNSVSLQPVNVSVLNNLEARFEILATSNQTLCLSQQPVRRICFSSGNLRNGDSDHCIVGLFLSWDTHNFESQPSVHWAVWTE